jgi:hypothetical protein
MALFNISTRRVGGIRFFKIGSLCLSFCITSGYKSLSQEDRAL